MSFASFTALESRTLLSGVHEEPHPAPTPTPTPTFDLDADRAKIVADVTKMQSDITAGMASLSAARQVRQSHVATSNELLKSLKAELAKDQKAYSVTSASFEAAMKALRVKWSAVIGPEEIDVRTNTEGETEEERAADKAKLESDRAAAMSEYTAVQSASNTARYRLQAEVGDDRAAVEAACKAAAAQTKVDALAISAAEKALRNVFQSDRLIVEADLKVYRAHGGKVDALKLVLPKLNTSDHK